jgi:uncharacterized protein YrzB (UPF0473 family)
VVRAIVHKDGDRTTFEVTGGNSNFGELQDGQEVQLAIVPDQPDDEFDAMIERLIEKNRDALDYLAESE